MCNVSFFHGYSVNYNIPKHNRERVYYRGIPDILHVGGHQFVETAIVRMWCTQNLVAWYDCGSYVFFSSIGLMKEWAGHQCPTVLGFTTLLSCDMHRHP